MFEHFFRKKKGKKVSDAIVKSLGEFGIKVEGEEIVDGYQASQHFFTITNDKSTEQVKSLRLELMLALRSESVLVDAVEDSEGKKFTVTVGRVGSREVLDLMDARKAFVPDMDKPMEAVLGATISREIYSLDLEQVASIAVAGVTGSGKSILFHSVINSLLGRNSPEQLQFILIDPKRVELTLYRNLPHLKGDVEVKPKASVEILKKILVEIDNRIALLAKNEVRNIKEYRKSVGYQAVPQIVIVIDEFSDLTLHDSDGVITLITEIAKKAKLAGVSLLLGTSRPSVEVYPNALLDSMDAVIVGMLANNGDSERMIGCPDAERLLGCGDMLISLKGSEKLTRIQTCFVSEREIIEKVKKYRS